MAWLDSLSPQTQFVFFTLLKIACVLGLLLTLVAYAVLAERKALRVEFLGQTVEILRLALLLLTAEVAAHVTVLLLD